MSDSSDKQPAAVNMPLTESKSVLTKRLTREGRWEEASRFKDELIAEYRRSGMKRVDAQYAAWAAMADKYPPLPVDPVAAAAAPPALSEDDVEEIFARTEGERPNLSRDAEWVYEHLDASNVLPVLAPSTGAWGLLHWAKTNRGKFYERYWPKFAPKPAEQREKSDVPMPNREAVESLMDEIWAAHLQSVVDDAEESVVMDVQDRFFTWQRHFELELPREARKALEQLMVSIACVSRKALQAAQPSAEADGP